MGLEAVSNPCRTSSLLNPNRCVIMGPRLTRPEEMSSMHVGYCLGWEREGNRMRFLILVHFACGTHATRADR